MAATSHDHHETDPLLPTHAQGSQSKWKSLFCIFTALTLSVFVASLDETIVATAALNIVAQFQAFNLYSWVSVAYLICLNASQPLYGKLSDIFGRRAAMVFGVLVFLIGSIGCGWAPDINIFLISRCIAGIGAGGMTGMAFLIVADMFPLEERPKYQSILMSSFGAASITGPILGGVITKRISWRWCFWINIPVCLITLATILAFLRPSNTHRGSALRAMRNVDFLGATTLVACVTCFMMPLTLGGNFWPWNSAPVYILTALFVILGGAFVYIEGRVAKDPIVPLRLMKNRGLVGAWITLSCYGMVFFSFMYYLPVWFEVVEGSSPEMTGLQLIPMLVGLVSAGVFFAPMRGIAARSIPRFPPTAVLIHLGTTVLLLGTILRTFVKRDTHQAVEAVGLLLLGFGAGLTLQTCFVCGQSAVDNSDLGVANSLSVFFENLGGSIGLSISATANRIELERQFTKLPADVISSEKLQSIQLNPALVHFPGDYLTPVARELVIRAFVNSLKITFAVSIAFAGIAFLTAFFIRHRRLGREVLTERTEEH